MQQALHAFLLGFPALFSIVNPIGGAFIFREATGNRPPAARTLLARKVAINSLVVMMGSLWAGSYILAFFGITLPALQIAGGLVLALSGWNLLNTPEQREQRRQQQAVGADAVDDIALFPLTIPLTTGPGTISVAVALGAGHPKILAGLGWFFLGMTGSAVGMALVIWVTYRSADRLVAFMGPNGSRTLARVAAFLLLCIGVQILIGGVQDVLEPVVSGRS